MVRNALKMVNLIQLISCIYFLRIHFVLFSPSGSDSPYTKTALEIVNVCKQTLAEVCETEESPLLSSVLIGF